MPYQTNAELPSSVKDHLPAHAQDIFREAFNHAYQEYGHDESQAFRVAWAAVEHEYHRDGDDKWVKGPTRGQ